MTKKTLVSVASATIIVLGGWYYSSSKSTPASTRTTQSDTVAAFTGTVRSTIQGVGTATASSTQNLQFNSNGKIVEWNVSPGDLVRKGQILAEVDSRDVDNDIRAQELSLKNAVLSYEKLFTNVKDYQISQMESSVASTERSILSAPKELENLEMERDAKIADQKSSIAASERSLAVAKEKLATLQSDIEYVRASSENAVGKSATDLSYILSTASLNAGTQLSESRAFIRDMESSVLNFDETNVVPVEFAARDSAKGTKAINAFSAFRWAVSSYASKLAASNLTDTGGVLAFLSERETLGNAGLVATDALSQALNASLPAGSMPQSAIDSLSSSVSQSRSKFSSYVSDAASTRKQIASLDDPALVRQNADNTVANKRSSMLDQQSATSSLEATLASQKAALIKLESDYEIKIQQKKDSVASLSETLKTSKLNLENLRKGPTEEEAKSVQNQIEQARISLAKAKKKKEDYQLIASFDGIVTASNGKVGEISTNSNSSNAASATSVTVEVPGLYEISVLVDQLDVVKIAPEQKAIIKFDSYAEKTFTGKVFEVDPTPVTSQGVVSYKAKILFRSDSLRVYNSMTATVTIITEERENAVLVPSASISESEGKKTVNLWNNGKSEKVEVKTGLVEGNDTEILSGVTLWNRVVNSAFKITTVKSSGFSLFGNRRSSASSTGSSATFGGNRENSGPPPGM